MSCDTSLERWVQDPKKQREYVAWFWALSKPLKAAAIACPPYIPCYRMEGVHVQLSHVVETLDKSSATFSVEFGRDSDTPGLVVNGVSADDLTPCGCEHWEPCPMNGQGWRWIQIHESQFEDDQPKTIH